LNQSGHPFDTPPVKIGAVVVWIALLALVPGMQTSQPVSSNQGWNLLQKHKYKDAHAVFDRLVKANTHSIDGWLGRACASSGLGKDEDAVQDCNQAENVIVGSGSADLRYSDGPNVYLERAICYYKLGKYEETVGDVTNVAQYDTNPQRKGMALYISSEALAKLGRTDESLAYRKIARDLGVNDPSLSGISIAPYRQRYE
jgi:tetratricopeptide (TPR) repeat protein